MKSCPSWAFISLATNGLFVIAIALNWVRAQILPTPTLANPAAPSLQVAMPIPESPSVVGQKQQLTYQQWVELLRREADAAAVNKPERLSILLGDSLTLWFAMRNLPPDKTWLNQGISGETSVGLLRRLEAIDRTQPEAIFIMIGINDLLRGVRDETLLANQRLILRYLKRTHPNAQIVIQSILPHSAEDATWEGRDRLLEIPNSRIRRLNQRLKEMAEAENVTYLDLHSLFLNEHGNLRTDLTTDGLHLNAQGYRLWSIALHVISK